MDLICVRGLITIFVIIYLLKNHLITTVFKINRRLDYSVRVLLLLAKHTPGTRQSIPDIQKEMLIPRAFIRRIVADLVSAGLIGSRPGRNGGIHLVREIHSISLRDIWEAIEGPLMISPCLEAPGVCPLDKTCPVRSKWIALQILISTELESVRLDQLAQEALDLRNLEISARQH